MDSYFSGGEFWGGVSESGSFTNSGTITASAQGGTNDVSYGVYAKLLDGTLTNTGTIRASASSDAYAVYLGGGTGTLNLFTSGTIEGLISVNAHDVNMTSDGNGSAYYAFEDRDTEAGTFSTFVEGGQPWHVSDEGGVNPIYATVGTTGMDASSYEIANVVSLGGGLGGDFAGLFGAPQSATISRNAPNDIVMSTMGSRSGFSKIVRGKHDTVTYSDADLNQRIAVGGLFAGGVGELENGLGFGVMGGLVSTLAKGGNSNGATFNNKSTGGLVELGLASQAQGAILDLGVHIGTLSHENKRFVTTGNGVETANASFNSVFYGVSLGAALPISMGDGMTVTPSARVSATQQNLGGYTESGATANAMIGSRKATTTEAKIGVEVAQQIKGGTLRGSLDLLSRHSSGDGAFDVTLFGTTASGSTSGRSDSFGQIGLGYEAQLGNGSTLDIFTSAFVGGGAIGGETVSATYRFDF